MCVREAYGFWFFPLDRWGEYKSKQNHAKCWLLIVLSSVEVKIKKYFSYHLCWKGTIGRKLLIQIQEDEKRHGTQMYFLLHETFIKHVKTVKY